MKINYNMIFFIVFVVLFYQIDRFFYSGPPNNNIILKSSFKVLDDIYSKKIKIDNFSKNVCNTYFEYLDPLKIYLTKQDFNFLTKNEQQSSESFTKDNLLFFQKTIKFFNKKLIYLYNIYNITLKKPFNFKLHEKNIFYKNNNFFCKDDNSLQNRIFLYLKYLTLLEVNSLLNIKNKIHNSNNNLNEISKYNFIKLEKKARKIVFDKIKYKFQALKSKNQSYWFFKYLNANLIQYNPYTKFFSEKEKNTFDINLSGQLEDLGIQLKNENGYITVKNFLKGSPLWKSKHIEIGDIIMKIYEKDSGKEINFLGKNIDKCIHDINGTKGSKVFLTIKKNNGSIKNTILTRGLIKSNKFLTKNVFILDKNKRYGLIKIPRFYTNYNYLNGINSFNDVKSQLTILKKKGINGLIIDLRNNLGGSLDSVINIIGLFINNKPILQVKNFNGKKRFIITKQNDHMWRGPLVLLVDKLTSSAAEIFASAIKDYNRGIIIGDSNTSGKGTIQKFYPLNKHLFIKNKIGFLKITTDKYYSLNGNSIEKKGIYPDIIIPYDYIHDCNYYLINDNDKEINKENSMIYDKIYAIKYNPYINNNKNIIINSNNRIKKNKNLQKIYTIIKELKAYSKKAFTDLNLEKFNNDKKNINILMNKINYLNNRYINNINFYEAEKKYLIDIMNSKNIDNYSWYKTLKKDFLVKEAINILGEYKNKE